ncbi:hypothetical protein Acr_00g0051590 [Actinidia rufa]|uniref:Uncharacterized protein n=1 Tax=Actinidia rufa TaxID=165716 RepID=A0A7J0DKV0_9ERIC|nr:hypothetical protein Acr_00g0051590 [Actinidia rufa]
MLLFVTEIAGAVISRDGAGNVIGAKVLYGSYLFPVAYSDAIRLGNIWGTSENWAPAIIGCEGLEIDDSRILALDDTHLVRAVELSSQAE